MFKLDGLKAAAGAKKAPKRKGRGIGSKLGKTAGKGHKGQKARSGGGPGPRHAFEGGQTPLNRKIPKVGFNSPLKALQVKVNVSELSKFAGKELSLKDVMPGAKVANPRIKVSIFGTKAPKTWPKSIEAHRVAPAAKKLLEDNGVKVEIKEYMSGALGKKKTAKTAS
ncbi:50S ribosomal protein L15 [bacterium]|nr:50S ribosomal protein L15 [bacterium]